MKFFRGGALFCNKANACSKRGGRILWSEVSEEQASFFSMIKLVLTVVQASDYFGL